MYFALQILLILFQGLEGDLVGVIPCEEIGELPAILDGGVISKDQLW